MKFYMTILFNLVISIFVLGCAKPKYYTAQGEQDNHGASSESNVSCQLPLVNQQACLRWYFESGAPTEGVYTTIIVKVYKLNLLDQSLIYFDIPDSTLSVVLWMPDPSMDHGSVPTSVDKLDVGTYRVRNVNFIMMGKWDIRFELKNSNNQMLDEAKGEYTLH